MVPHNFATAHIFCASQDGLRSSNFLREMPANAKLFTTLQENKIHF